MQQTIIWGISADDWRTISIVAQGVLMIFLVVTGIYQLLAIRKQAKRAATLDMCTRLAADALLCNNQRILHEARVSGELEQDPLKFRPYIIPILNFLDMVAIGVARGIYDEKLAHDYMKWVIKQFVKWYLTGSFPQKANISLSVYKDMLDLNQKWNDPTNVLSDDEKNTVFNVVLKTPERNP